MPGKSLVGNAGRALFGQGGLPHRPDYGPIRHA